MHIRDKGAHELADSCLALKLRVGINCTCILEAATCDAARSLTLARKLSRPRDECRGQGLNLGTITALKTSGLTKMGKTNMDENDTAASPLLPPCESQNL